MKAARIKQSAAAINHPRAAKTSPGTKKSMMNGMPSLALDQ
jgi:hypothetical protein